MMSFIDHGKSYLVLVLFVLGCGKNGDSKGTISDSESVGDSATEGGEEVESDTGGGGGADSESVISDTEPDTGSLMDTNSPRGTDDTATETAFIKDSASEATGDSEIGVDTATYREETDFETDSASDTAGGSDNNIDIESDIASDTGADGDSDSDIDTAEDGGTISGWPEGKYIPIDAVFEKVMSADPDMLLINVVDEVFYNLGHIEGSLKITWDTLEAKLGSVDATKHVVVYCRRGVRSESAYTTLIENNFPMVWVMEGGIEAWTGKGYPVVYD